MNAKRQSIAVIGCGYWGKNLVRNFAELGALAAVCDRHPGHAEPFSKQYNVPILTTAQVFDNPDIEAVILATPAPEHAPLAQRALMSGKHVFVEKPLALSPDKARSLQALATEKNKILMVGHLLQYHPAYMALRELVTSGELGDVRYIHSTRLNLGKIRTEENALWSLAPHDISMVLGLTGEAPVSVFAQGSASLTRDVADTVTTQMQFSNGVQAQVFVSWLFPFKEQKMSVVGSKAMAVFDDTLPFEQKLVIYRHKINWPGGLPVPEAAKAEPVTLQPGEPLKNECQHFLDSIANHTTPRTDGAEGIRVLDVLDAAEQSMRDNTPVRLGEPKHGGVFVHETSVVDEGCDIGEGSKIWHFSHILKGTVMGRDCTVGQNVMIGPDVKMGNQCKIQNNVSLYKGVVLEDGVFVGPSAVFTNVNTPRAEIERKNEYIETHVGRAVTIGANATIICGVNLGAYCLIGAGAVVTKDVRPHALVAGNPAKQMGWVSHAGERMGDDLVCPREGRKYRVGKDGALQEIQEKKNARVA